MAALGFTLFDTAIGRCGIAWGRGGSILGTQLPEATEVATRARLRTRFPTAEDLIPPRVIAAAVKDIVALLAGSKRDLTGIALDMANVPEFHRKVYTVTRSIAPGATLTYGEVATRVGTPGAARAVGQALGRNPFAIIVPCHRVLAAGGRLGGFSADGGVTTKRRILEIEGAASAPTLPLFESTPPGRRGPQGRQRG